MEVWFGEKFREKFGEKFREKFGDDLRIRESMCNFYTLQYFYLHRWREVKFLGYKYFGILTKDNEEENEAEMKYDAFFCYR